MIFLSLQLSSTLKCELIIFISLETFQILQNKHWFLLQVYNKPYKSLFFVLEINIHSILFKGALSPFSESDPLFPLWHKCPLRTFKKRNPKFFNDMQFFTWKVNGNVLKRDLVSCKVWSMFLKATYSVLNKMPRCYRSSTLQLSITQTVFIYLLMFKQGEIHLSDAK